MDSQTTSQYVNVVDQLPPEILRTILHTSLELSDSDEFNHTQALRYSLVSQYWLEVVHSLPRYLNSVSISNDVAIVRLHDHIKRAEPGRLGSKIKTLRLCRSLNNLDKVSQLLHTCRNLESVYAYQPTILSWYFCRYETEWPTLTELELANINSFTSLELICKMCINLRKFWINGPSHHSIANYRSMPFRSSTHLFKKYRLSVLPLDPSRSRPCPIFRLESKLAKFRSPLLLLRCPSIHPTGFSKFSPNHLSGHT